MPGDHTRNDEPQLSLGGIIASLPACPGGEEGQTP